VNKLNDIDLFLTKAKERGIACTIYAEERDTVLVRKKAHLTPVHQIEKNLYVRAVRGNRAVELLTDELSDTLDLLENLLARGEPDPNNEIISPEPLDESYLEDPKLNPEESWRELVDELRLMDPSGRWTGEVMVGKINRSVQSTEGKGLEETVTLIYLRKIEAGLNLQEFSSSTRLEDPELRRVIEFSSESLGEIELKGEITVELSSKVSAKLIEKLILPMFFPETSGPRGTVGMNLRMTEDPRMQFSPYSRSFDAEGLRTSPIAIKGRIDFLTNSTISRRFRRPNTRSATWIREGRLTARPTNLRITSESKEEGRVIVEEIGEIESYDRSLVIVPIQVVRKRTGEIGLTYTKFVLDPVTFLEQTKGGTMKPMRYGRVTTPSLTLDVKLY